MATSSTLGHKIVWQNSQWIYSDTQAPIDVLDRPCKKCNRKTVSVLVKVPSDLSYSGRSYWKMAKIDACIAPIIKALQKSGIDMRSSCCGHGESYGRIELQDGRTLVIKYENG